MSLALLELTGKLGAGLVTLSRQHLELVLQLFSTLCGLGKGTIGRHDLERVFAVDHSRGRHHSAACREHRRGGVERLFERLGRTHHYTTQQLLERPGGIV
jgi:hypothetical protein